MKKNTKKKVPKQNKIKNKAVRLKLKANKKNKKFKQRKLVKNM